MRAILFTLLSVACTATLAATVYKWVDENGVVHYSDQPHENAQKVTIAAPQTYSAPHTSASNKPQTRKAETSNTYSSCTIVQPAADQTFQNVSSVGVAAAADPAPHDGDQMVLMLDGSKVLNFPAGGGAYTIDPIDRGQHSVQVQVQDSNGKTLCQSSSVSFTVLQASTLNPANPNFRH
jgi:hypothetical protein